MVLKGAIFDLDGTLLDSTDIWAEIDTVFFARRGMTVPDDYFHTISPLGFTGAAQYTVKRFCFSETPEQILDEWNDLSIDAFTNRVKIKPGVREYLDYLHSCGVPCVIATASHPELFVPALRNNGVLDCFDSYTTTLEVNSSKGSPDVYLKAAQKLSLSPESCAVFEDIVQGVICAKSRGFHTVAVYDKGSEKQCEKLKSIADRYVTKLDELIGARLFEQEAMRHRTETGNE